VNFSLRGLFKNAGYDGKLPSSAEEGWLKAGVVLVKRLIS
jgi:hypothetical protein